jgi:magnesium-transporting ATPase (P-type)
MRRPPRTCREKLLDRALLARAYLFLGPLEAVAALAAFFFVLWGGGWQYGQALAGDEPLYLQATTACLTAIIIAQVANLFACRSERDLALSLGVAGNGLLPAGIALAVLMALAIDYTPVGNRLFGTAPISPAVWLFAVPFAVGLLGLDELRKWVLRRNAAAAATLPKPAVGNLAPPPAKGTAAGRGSQVTV